MTGQAGDAGRPLLPGERPVRVGDLRGGRGQGAGRQDAAQPGPGVAAERAQRLAEVAPDDLAAGQAEAAPPVGDRGHDLKSPAAFGQPEPGRSCGVAGPPPSQTTIRRRSPQAVARSTRPPTGPSHHGVGVQLAHGQGRVGRVDGALVPDDDDRIQSRIACHGQDRRPRPAIRSPPSAIIAVVRVIHAAIVGGPQVSGPRCCEMLR